MKLPFPLTRCAGACALALAAPSLVLRLKPLSSRLNPRRVPTHSTQDYRVTTSQGATKSDRPLLTTPQSVSVITRQQIQDQGALDLNQALNYTPGVFTNFAGAATRYDTLSLRGFHGGDVDNTFLDGLRVMSDGGSFNVLQVDNWFLERIDVIKGPSSALYGQTVPGGLVNMTTRRPRLSEEGHFQLSAGTNATTNAAFDYTSALNEQWAFRLTGITRNSDTQYDHTREEKYALMPQLLWQPTEDTHLILRAYLQKDPSGGYHGSVPGDGSITEHNGYKLSNGFYEGNSDLDQFKRHEQIYSYDFLHQFNDIWSFSSLGSYSHSNVDLDQVYQTGWDAVNPDVLNRYYSGERSSLTAWATDNRLQASFTTGELEHRVSIGAEYHRYKNDISNAGGAANQLNALTGEQVGTLPTYTWSEKPGAIIRPVSICKMR